MSIRTNIAAVTAVALLSVGGAFAGPFALYASYTFAHDKATPTGGLRYSLNSDICFDAGAGAAIGYKDSSENGFSFYADAFFIGQTLGLGVTIAKYGEDDIVPALSLMYALEKPINDNITLGISPTLLYYEIADGNGLEIFNGVNLYTLIAW